MRMRRRDLFTCAAAGAATLFFPDPRRGFGLARAASSSTGALVFTVEATNAWDPTFLMDPKVDPAFTPWAVSDIRTVPGTTIQYAPRIWADGTRDVYRVGADGQDFFLKHGSKLLVINGIDTATVSHDIGPRVVFGGSNRDGIPTLAGLVAATRGATLPLALMSTGGFVTTDGLVPITRASSTNTLLALSRSNYVAQNPNSSNPSATFHDAGIFELLRTHARQRDARRAAASSVMRETTALEGIATTREVDMAAQFDALAAPLASAAAETSTNTLIPKASAILATMAAGACVAAHMETAESFDTHADHDQDHPVAMQELVELLDFILTRAAEDPVLAARGLLVVVASDFGRTRYNADAGKDHWPITSMMVAGVGAASPLVEGGRTVGLTHTSLNGISANGLLASKVKEANGALVVAEDDDPQGIQLTAGHVHLALRETLGIAQDPIVQRYPLTAVAPQSPLPILRRG